MRAPHRDRLASGEEAFSGCERSLTDGKRSSKSHSQAGEGEAQAFRVKPDESGVMAPKKPLSPFIFFSQQARRAIKKENPTLHAKEIMSMVQRQWKRMNDDEKAAYLEQSKSDR